MPPSRLIAALRQVLGDARLTRQRLPDTPIDLWLINPDEMRRAFSPEETQQILEQPPYWCFCWASGLALARWLLQHPEWVRGQRVVDIGSGSGVVAIAAALAGAREVVACDLDPLAQAAAQANAALNGVALEMSSDLLTLAADFDRVLVADLLYDRSNLSLLEPLCALGQQVLIADSRLKSLEHPAYQVVARLHASTLPDLAEPEEFREVILYHAQH